MSLQKKILGMIAIAVFGLLLTGGFSLYSLRQSILAERNFQITHLLQLAEAMLNNYQSLEASGKLSHEEAQQQALRALTGLRKKSSYFFVRTDNNIMLVHPKAEKVGKYDRGSKRTDGRWSSEVYPELFASTDYITENVFVARPDSADKTLKPKLNGLYHFKPWGWMVGIGVFLDDVDTAFWQQALALLGLAGVATALVVAGAAAILRSIQRSLGGDPAYAAEVVRAIADGDLTREVAVNGPPTSLLAAMSAMQGKLREMVAQIHRSTAGITSASHELCAQMDKVNEVSTVASGSTASAAAAVEQLSVSIDHVKDNTQETEAGARETVSLASQGEQAAGTAAQGIQTVAGQIHEVSGMVDTLAERTRNISGIADTIRDIADQTNLLALNAAIEAARAGESGRGFAVVADEVRKLAERTSSATTEISSIVQSVVQETGGVSNRMESIRPAVLDGVDKVNKAAEMLGHINKQAHQALDHVHAVTLAMAEQSQAGANIAKSVEQVANVTEETESSVEQALAAVKAIDGLAVGLNESVARFRV
jgi:methyl-accepting chemotaxis protein/methyl-accepting chemotaxis protein-3 (ribose and galactose sensor receptor)